MFVLTSVHAEERDLVATGYEQQLFENYIVTEAESYSFDIDKPVRLHITFDTIEGNAKSIAYMDYMHTLYKDIVVFGESDQTVNISVGSGILKAVKNGELPVQFPKLARTTINARDYCYSEASLQEYRDTYKTAIIVFDPSMGGSIAECIQLNFAKLFGFNISYKQYITNLGRHRDNESGVGNPDIIQLDAVVIRHRCEKALAERDMFRACVQDEIKHKEAEHLR